MLTRILNESPRHFVINDLYVLQMIDAADAWHRFSSRDEQLAFLKRLTWMVVQRSGVDTPAIINNSSRLTKRELDTIVQRISPQKVEFGNWAFTVDFVMQQIGDVTGRIFWGWNTPQDHHHIKRIKDAFPKAKILFLVRNPSAVALSYKNHWKKEATDRYHIIAQSLAWKKAARNYFVAKNAYKNSTFLVTYEEIIENTSETIASVNTFLGSEVPIKLDLKSIGSNSSYFRDTKRLPANLSPLELWLSDLILFQERSRLGYTDDFARVSIVGVPELISNTARFASCYSSTMLRSRDTRKRVLRLLRG